MKTNVFAPRDERRPQLERLAFHLAQCCTVTHTNPHSCPLYALRRLAAGKKRAWIRGLTLEQLDYLAVYHATCAAEQQRVAAARRPARRRLSRA